MLLRRFTAVVLAAVMMMVSFGATVAKASTELMASPDIAFSQHSDVTGKPCHRAILPGAPSTCPLASFSVSAIPGTETTRFVLSGRVSHLRWNGLTASCAPQWQASAVYRPPRPRV